MQRQILFAVGQDGSVEYLAPLWRRWLDSTPAPGWRVALSAGARERLPHLDLEDLPVVAGEPGSVTSLEAALGSWRPDIVLASASYCPVEEAAFRYARRRGIAVMRFIDTWYRYRDRLCTAGGVFAVPDRVLVIDEYAVAEARAEGVPGEALLTVGHPAWEVVSRLPAADRRDVMFVSQPVARFYGDVLGYTERSAWDEFLEVARARPDLVRRILFAPHPNDDMPPPPANDLVTVVPSGRKALAEVGTVVGMFSSLLADALLAGRHVVSFQPHAVGIDMNAMGRDSFMPRARTTAELVEALAGESACAAELRRALAGSCDRLEEVLLTFPGMARAAAR